MSESSSDLAPSGRYSSRYLFLAAVVFIVAAPVFWQRTQTRPEAVVAAYENADLYQAVYPTFYYGFGRLRAEEVPLWNPKQLCGTPFMANPQAGVPNRAGSAKHPGPAPACAAQTTGARPCATRTETVA